jgi:hypothetical protein
MHDRLVLPRLSWAGWLTVAGVFETYSLLGCACYRMLGTTCIHPSGQEEI